MSSAAEVLTTNPDRMASQTLASAVCANLRQEIIAGSLRPGQKLRLRELADRFRVGLSPIREALNRLVSDGFVELFDLRGFSVSRLTEADLDELIRARCWLNEIGVRQSIARGDAAWEESVVIAHHRLSRTPRWVSEGIVNQQWEMEHRAFHAAILSACGSGWITRYCEQLFDLADRYRRLSRLAPSAQERQGNEHQAIMAACIARNADEAASLLNRHLQRTAELCREELRRLNAEAANQSRRKSKP